MYVPENVILGLHSFLHSLQQLDTSGPDSGTNQIAVPNGRRMREQNIRIFRYLAPLAQALLASPQIKSPIPELGLPENKLIPTFPPENTRPNVTKAFRTL